MAQQRAVGRLGMLLGALWSSAIATGALVAALSVVAEPPPILPAVVLLAVSLPYGLIRPAVPALWALALALPSGAVALAQRAGWSAVLPLAYALAGVYAGAWVGKRIARRASHSRASEQA